MPSKVKSESYKQRHLERRKRLGRAKSAECADIGTIPEVVDPERRESCRLDLHLFLRTYFPESTGHPDHPFGPAQIRAIERIQHAILNGGNFLNTFPRGFAKTTISENATIWASVYGHRLYTLFVGATAGDAKNAIDSIGTELAENDLLDEDFPEVTFAIRHLEGKAQRAHSQSHKVGNLAGNPGEIGDAQQTHVGFRSEELVLPHILVPEGWGVLGAELDWDNLAPSVSSGVVIKSRGITSASRGLKHKTPDGKNVRPSLVLLDDFQTDESAASPPQVDKRLEIIEKSLMMLGGHGKKVSVVIGTTCICDGDAVCRLSDPEEFPSFEVEKIKAVPKMPSDECLETHWLGEYKSIRHGFNREVPGDRANAYRRATEYYIANREVMDSGVEVAWPDMPLESDEVSAAQHCLNFLCDQGESVFLSELQNEPRKALTSSTPLLTAEEYARRVNGYGHRVVVPGASQVVGFIDAHDNVLYYTVACVSQGFNGHIIDYGTFPDQKTTRSFRQQSVKHTLQDAYGLSVEENIQQGLMDLVDKICGTPWIDTDGVVYPVRQLLIDTGWAPDAVRYVLRNSDYKDVLAGAKGMAPGPDAKQMPEYDTSPKRMKRCGPDPRAPRWFSPAGGKELMFNIDTNFWKDTLVARFATPSSRDTSSVQGAWYLYGSHRDVPKHRHIAQHMTSETPTLVSSNGRTINRWRNPSGGQNHWFDCLVGCAVAASIAGCHLPGFQPEPAAPKKRQMSLKELKSQSRHISRR